MKPVFIFSSPRAGSTLLQRTLTSHDKISTTAEPWVLLSCFYALKESGCFAEYNHFTLQRGVKDFCQSLPNGEDDYYVAIRHFAEELYDKASDKEAVYFLDKTPRYSLIVKDIIKTFPDGNFIFLWRNPLAIIASMIKTWGQGRWNLYDLKIDLFHGMEELIEANIENKHNKNCMSCNYEDLISNPKGEIESIFRHLNLENSTTFLEKLPNNNPKGRLGDPTGTFQYESFSDEPIQKWKSVISNPIRKAWCRKYILWIGEERLQIMGYDLNSLLLELNETPTSWEFLFSDIINIVYGVIYNFLEFPQLKKKFVNLYNKIRVVSHK